MKHLHHMLPLLLLPLLVCTLQLHAQTAAPEGIPADVYLTAPPEIASRKAFQREKWFYEQRAYPEKIIPAGARQRALEQADLLNGSFRKGGGSQLFSFTRWSVLGPAPGQFNNWGYVSGRTTAIAIDPNNPSRLFIGGASGGVWRSEDRGITWVPLTDNEASLATGSIALDPSNTNVIYVGTGEATYSGSSYYGNGLLKSTDGGNSWKHLTNGIPTNAVTSRLLVSSRNTSVILTALGTRGIYRSSDAGDTWVRTYGARVDDIVFHPTNNDIVFGIGGDNTGLIRSTDMGVTWSQYGTSLPRSAGRMHLDLCNAQPSMMYAATYNEANSGKVKMYKSTDGGLLWTALAPAFDFKGSQAWYDFYLRTHPVNPLVCFLGTIEIFRTTDGGTNWTDISKGYSNGPVHVDQHDLRVDPKNPSTLYAGCDGGVYRSSDLGDTWTSMNSSLVLTQFYRIAASPSQEKQILGGTQDNGTQQTLGQSMWTLAFGGDGAEVCFSRQNPQSIIGESQNGGLMYSTNGGFAWQSGLDGVLDKPGGGKEDAAWVAPIVSHPNGSRTFYHGRVNLYKSTNGGKFWTMLADSVFGNKVIDQLAISNNSSNPYIYCATDGKISVSTDGGNTFSNITSNLPNRSITSVYTHPHPDSQSVVFVTLSGFGSDNVWRRKYDNSGWFSLSGNLPQIPVNDIVVHPDYPDRFFIVATDIGVYATEDGGKSWGKLSTGLPNCVVMHLDYHVASKKLRAGTHGRSVWEMTLMPKGVLPPRNLVAGASKYTATVSWEPSPTAGVINYSIYRGTKTGMGTHVANVGTSLAFINNGLENNTTYYYRIRAVSATDSSDFSVEVSAMPRVWQGCIGKVASFTASGHHMTVPAAINVYDALTVEGWVWWKNFKTWSRFIDLGARDKSFLVANEAQTNTLVFQVYGPAGANGISVPRALSLDRPVHVAAVSGPGGMKLYLDGILMDTHPYTGSIRSTGATTITNYIGRSNWSSDLNFSGEMDEIRFWKVERTAAQIRGAFNRTLTQQEIADTNLVAYYTFENISGTTLLDASTKKNNAELKQGLQASPCSTPVGVDNDDITPLMFELKQNHPNPFNPTTTIEYILDRPGFITLEVYNSLGEKIASPVNNEYQQPGRYSQGFDATNLPSGVYFYLLRTETRSAAKRMMLMK